MVLKMLKGQGATEYLVLLAVVLIIALVSIALLGFFPGIVPDARITQANSYWSSARPFAIVESTQSGTIMNVVLRNNDASGSLVIQNIGIGTGHNATLTVAQATFGPGETKNVTLTGTAACTSGSIFDYPVGINYTTANGIQAVQYGGKNLLGKCS